MSKCNRFLDGKSLRVILVITNSLSVYQHFQLLLYAGWRTIISMPLKEVAVCG